jgi:hypothetical protein
MEAKCKAHPCALDLGKLPGPRPLPNGWRARNAGEGAHSSVLWLPPQPIDPGIRPTLPGHVPHHRPLTIFLSNPVAGVSLDCRGALAAGDFQLWARSTANGGLRMMEAIDHRRHSPYLWPCPGVGFNADTSVPVSLRAGLAEETSDPTQSSSVADRDEA